MRWGGRGRTYDRLDQMIEEAMKGTFTERSYDESQLSRLEAKWRQYLLGAEQSKGQAAKERQVLTELVSNISHQTRTPLANIRLYGELLREQAGDGPQAALTKRLLEQTDRLEFLIQTLTKMSRLEAGMIQVQPKEQSVWPLLENVCAQAEEKARARGVTVVLEKGEPLWACFDEKWTAEAVYNVLDNGVKYSPRGSRVRVRAQATEVFARISVWDQGMGVTEEESAKIFQRFYRSPRVSQEEGVGVGLFLTREILSRQGGLVKVASGRAVPEGVGSVFSLYLPREQRG